MALSDLRCPKCRAWWRPTSAPGDSESRCPDCGTSVPLPDPVPAATVPVALPQLLASSAAPAPPVARVAVPPPAPPARPASVPRPLPVAAPAPAPRPVPVARPAPPPRAVPPAPVEEPEDEPDLPRRTKTKSKKKKKSKEPNLPLILGGVGGGVLLLVLLVGGILLSGRNSRTTPTTPIVASSGNPTIGPSPSPNQTPFQTPIVAPTTTAPPRSGGDVIQRVKDSTVYIRCHETTGQMGMGSGFFAGPPGFVVTNAHVVGYGPEAWRRPARIDVVIASGELNQRVLTATLFGVDADTDLAVLKVDGPNLPPPLAFGSASALRETDELVIFGYPLGESLGLNISVNKTTVSSLRKENGRISIVQVSGGMSPGNSGGPVTSPAGQVMAVSVAGIPGFQINFAIPADKAAAFVAAQIASGGRIDTGRLPPAGNGPRVRPPVGRRP